MNTKSIDSLMKTYDLDRNNASELQSLLLHIKPLGIKSSKMLSKYIVENKLGYKYQNISGIVRMRDCGEEWDFRGGFPPRIYAIICTEMDFNNFKTTATPIGFISFKKEMTLRALSENDTDFF